MAMSPAPQNAVPYAGTNRDEGGADHLLAARDPAQHPLPVLASAILSPGTIGACLYSIEQLRSDRALHQYRQTVRDEIEAQIAEFWQEKQTLKLRLLRRYPLFDMPIKTAQGKEWFHL